MLFEGNAVCKNLLCKKVMPSSGSLATDLKKSLLTIDWGAIILYEKLGG